MRFSVKSLFRKTRLCTAILCLFLPNLLFSQYEKGQVVFTAGVSVWPGLNFMADYGLTSRFSMGAAYTRTWQQENIYRNNFGLRPLYHFDNGDNWDFYIGARFGLSSWGRKGTNVPYYSYFSLIKLNFNQLYPSAQFLFGGRYLVRQWLGLTAELGLGSPYLGSLGITMNINNTRKAIQEIKEKERPDPLPVEQKNVIKLNLNSLALIPSISFERYLKKRYTIEIGGSFQFKTAPLQGGDFYRLDTTIYEADSLNQVIKAYSMLRIYLNPAKQVVPCGWYMGIIATWHKRKSIVHAEDLSPNPGTLNFDYEKESDFIAGGLIFGYQMPISRRFTADFCAGAAAGPTYEKPFRYLDSNTSETDFRERFGSHKISTAPDLRFVVCKISLGYRF